MNAQLKPIEVRAAVAPACDNTHIANFHLWSKANHDRLLAHYFSIGGKPWSDPNLDNLLATARAEKFSAWMVVRWDIEKLRSNP